MKGTRDWQKVLGTCPPHHLGSRDLGSAPTHALGRGAGLLTFLSLPQGGFCVQNCFKSNFNTETVGFPPWLTTNPINRRKPIFSTSTTEQLWEAPPHTQFTKNRHGTDWRGSVRKAAGSIPGQGIHLGCRFGPRWGQAGDSRPMFLSHITVFLSLSLSPPPFASL